MASFCLYLRGEDGAVAAAAFGDTETRTAETSTEDPTALCWPARVNGGVSGWR